MLVERAREVNERLRIKSAGGVVEAEARVVYCQRLLNGRFALGLEFKGDPAMWLGNSAVVGD